MSQILQHILVVRSHTMRFGFLILTKTNLFIQFSITIQNENRNTTDAKISSNFDATNKIVLI